MKVGSEMMTRSPCSMSSSISVSSTLSRPAPATMRSAGYAGIASDGIAQGPSIELWIPIVRGDLGQGFQCLGRWPVRRLIPVEANHSRRFFDRRLFPGVERKMMDRRPDELLGIERGPGRDALRHQISSAVTRRRQEVG